MTMTTRAKPRLRLAYIAQLAVPQGVDRRAFSRLRGGDDEVEAFRGLLEGLGLEGAFDLIGVHADRGEAPSLDYDAVVLGGSFASVNDHHPWQARMIEWLGRYRATGRFFLGICGGHQLACSALGGVVDRREAGLVLGTMAAELTDAGQGHWLFDGMGAEPLFQFAHFDHVTQMPPGSAVLARCLGTVAAADLGGGWVTTQFHPEVACDRLAAYYHALVEDRAVRFGYVTGAEQLIGNFLRRALADQTGADEARSA